MLRQARVGLWPPPEWFVSYLKMETYIGSFSYGFSGGTFDGLPCRPSFDAVGPGSGLDAGGLGLHQLWKWFIGSPRDFELPGRLGIPRDFEFALLGQGDLRWLVWDDLRWLVWDDLPWLVWDTGLSAGLPRWEPGLSDFDAQLLEPWLLEPWLFEPWLLEPWLLGARVWQWIGLWLGLVGDGDPRRGQSRDGGSGDDQPEARGHGACG